MTFDSDTCLLNYKSEWFHLATDSYSLAGVWILLTEVANSRNANRSVLTSTSSDEGKDEIPHLIFSTFSTASSWLMPAFEDIEYSTWNASMLLVVKWECNFVPEDCEHCQVKCSKAFTDGGEFYSLFLKNDVSSTAGNKHLFILPRTQLCFLFYANREIVIAEISRAGVYQQRESSSDGRRFNSKGVGRLLLYHDLHKLTYRLEARRCKDDEVRNKVITEQMITSFFWHASFFFKYCCCNIVAVIFA